MRRLLLAAASAAVGVLGVGMTPAMATNDTTLMAPPGVYFGNGNSNTHWTTNITDNVELGLQANLPGIGPVTPVGNVYSVAPGADWNFNFSINTQAGGGLLTLGNVTTALTFTDLGTGATQSFDPGTIPDNATHGTTGFQNSEGLHFSIVASALNDSLYDINANDTYLFTLSAEDSGGSLGSVSETVVVGTGVPEPASLAVLGVGLLGLGFVVTRRRRHEGVGATAA